MSQDYARILRSDWEKLGANALARELYNILNTAPATSGEGGNKVFIGTVVSGSGSEYTVALDTGVQVDLTVPGILETEEIPADSVAPVIQMSDGTYKMIFPLWLE